MMAFPLLLRTARSSEYRAGVQATRTASALSTVNVEHRGIRSSPVQTTTLKRLAPIRAAIATIIDAGFDSKERE
jgi:hypothetical protein